MAAEDEKRKNIVLRLSPKLWEELVSWSEDEFRSLNGQIEYLLTDAVNKRKKNSKEINGSLPDKKTQRDGSPVS